MRPAIGWPIAVLFGLLSVIAFANGEALNQWVRENAIVIDSDDEATLVGITNDERWFVVLIDFPDQNENTNCNQQRASNLIDDGAEDHIKQAFGQSISLQVDYHADIITTGFSLGDYGHDVEGEKDVGKNGVNPHILAQEVVTKVKDDVPDWTKYDLNNDGWVDRFLILHCTKPQEDGGGASSRIWSHFSSIEEVVDLPNDMKISHYTIASQYSSNNFGTIMHEMYHQLGAADLYAVHDATVNQDWKGIGKWDIMASGNWNGDGAWPALPTSPSIELIGGQRHQEIELEWFPGTGCIGPVYSFEGFAEGGDSLKIPIGDEEYVWIEYRSDFGYDSNLPGNGILVLQQDLRAGEIEDNLVNSHPDRAWLKVIEADGEQNMVAGNNEGEESDVFNDGGQFGREGIQIRNRDGILVDWSATVNLTNGTPTIEFSSPECGHITDIDLPDFGSVLTIDDNIPIEIDCEGVQYNLESSDGRSISVTDNEIKFIERGVKGVLGLISGTIECSQGTPFDIQHEFEILGNIPIETSYKSKIPVTDSSRLEIPIELIGEGSQVWLIGIDGPLSRVAKTSATQELTEGSNIILDISPSGLLQEGMIVRGEIVLASDSGHNYHIDVELVAKNADSSTYEEWTSPAKLIPLALLLAAVWVILGIQSSTRKVTSDEEELPATSIYGDDPSFVDPFREPY